MHFRSSSRLAGSRRLRTRPPGWPRSGRAARRRARRGAPWPRRLRGSLGAPYRSLATALRCSFAWKRSRFEGRRERFAGQVPDPGGAIPRTARRGARSKPRRRASRSTRWANAEHVWSVSRVAALSMAASRRPSPRPARARRLHPAPPHSRRCTTHLARLEEPSPACPAGRLPPLAASAPPCHPGPGTGWARARPPARVQPAAVRRGRSPARAPRPSARPASPRRRGRPGREERAAFGEAHQRRRRPTMRVTAGESEPPSRPRPDPAAAPCCRRRSVVGPRECERPQGRSERLRVASRIAGRAPQWSRGAKGDIVRGVGVQVLRQEVRRERQGLPPQATSTASKSRVAATPGPRSVATSRTVSPGRSP